MSHLSSNPPVHKVLRFSAVQVRIVAMKGHCTSQKNLRHQMTDPESASRDDRFRQMADLISPFAARCFFKWVPLKEDGLYQRQKERPVYPKKVCFFHGPLSLGSSFPFLLHNYDFPSSVVSKPWSRY